MANNKTKAKNPVGRPRKFKSVESMEAMINAYFIMCDESKVVSTDTKGKTSIRYKPYTISGLCLFLDLTYEGLLEYQAREEYSETIKKAKKRVENWIEEHSINGDLNPAVSIFNLKNNFGWKDKTEIDMNANIKIDKLENFFKE